MKKNCIFCKIIKKQIPANIIYEDDKTLAFLDIRPVNAGHTLVIPKEHYETITDTPEKTLAAMIKTTKKVAKAIKKGLNIKGFNIHCNNGKISGQIVPHVHLHIIPRLSQDNLKLWPQKEYKQGEAEKVLKKIKQIIINN